VAALPLCTWIIRSYGWRTSFVITGMIGILWSVVWYAIYRHPTKHPLVSDAEREHIISDQAPANPAMLGPKVPWSSLFKYRAVWGMMMGFFCLNFVIYFFVTWFPTYLRDGRGFTDVKTGIYGMVPGLFAIVAGWIGGKTSDFLLRRGFSLTKARKIPIVCGMAIASSIGLAVVVPSATGAVALLALSYGGLCFAAASIWSLPADIAPTPRHVASIGGIQNFASNLAGICITYLVGKLLAKTGGFVAPLMLAGGFAILGALSYLFVVPEIKPLESKETTGVAA
jgi:ACS family D-galactonate transporter-like MFS transporter